MDIKKERTDRSITQRQFAELLGVTRKTIANYESGGNIPLSKIKLFQSILKEYDDKNSSSESNTNNTDKFNNIVFTKILEKFENITDDEIILYFDFKKEVFLKHPLIKSIIKSEAWEIVEQEMRNVIIENKLDNNTQK